MLVLAPVHIDTLPDVLTVGSALTVTVSDAVFVQPFAAVPVTVYVVVTVGVAVTGVPVVALKPVAGPHTYVAAPPALSEVELPMQLLTLPEVVTVGSGLTVTVTLPVLVQPPASVPVTVYVIVTVGVAVTEAPVVALNAVDGVHTYVLAPLAVSGADCPEHIVAGLAVIVREGLTVTVRLAVLVQPFTSVPVTV